MSRIVTVLFSLALALAQPRLEIDNVVTAARAPPELDADALLRLLETGLVAGRRNQLELAVDALRLSGYTREKLALSRTGGGGLLAR